MFLHAHQLSFTWPDTGVEFSASSAAAGRISPPSSTALNAPKEKQV